MEKINAVVFDMDGVLLDSEKIWDWAWKKHADELQLNNVESSCNACRGCNGEEQKKILHKIYGDNFDAEKFFKNALSYFYQFERENGIPKKYYAKEILDYLKEKKYKLALASSTNREAVERQMKNAGLLDFFDVTICGDEVKESKPNAEIYLKSCMSLGESACNCAAVEDSPNGIRSAFGAKMNCIMVPDRIPCSDEIQKFLWKKIDSLEELKNIL